MKILVTGCTGQVGTELVTTLSSSHKLVATSRQSRDCPIDLSQTGDLEKKILTIQPDLIINAAAYTAVDQAENDIQNCNLINYEAVQVLGATAHKLGIPIIHYSTDYVFDGKHSVPRTESDPTSPINEYGASKLRGEEALKHSGALYFILRTSWVFSATGRNFLGTMLRLGRDRTSLNVVADQLGTPTSVTTIASVTGKLISTLQNTPKNLWQDLSGIYHLTSSGETSWAEFAKLIMAEASKFDSAYKDTMIHPIPTAEYPTTAQRPSYSTLDCRKIKNFLNIDIPTWESSTRQTVAEIFAAKV